ncbi:MAG: hypothetical protein Q8S84_06750 [bacterium]|nr:hypothetical protein [bacterium]MDP3381158.1 hypothetical protein [bacterium]
MLGIFNAVTASFPSANTKSVATKPESRPQLNHINAFSHQFCFQNSFITYIKALNICSGSSKCSNSKISELVAIPSPFGRAFCE